MKRAVLYVITTPAGDAQYIGISMTRKGALAAFGWWRDWSRLYRKGWRCRKVKLVEVKR
jgi:hypothetical protein